MCGDRKKDTRRRNIVKYEKRLKDGNVEEEEKCEVGHVVGGSEEGGNLRCLLADKSAFKLAWRMWRRKVREGRK